MMRINYYKYLLLVWFFLIISISFKASNESDFLLNQKKFPRVRAALNEKEKELLTKLQAHKLNFSNLNILLVAYKSEGVLEVYVKSINDAAYRIFTSYKICYASGNLGPKFKKGDAQVPEGFYSIDRFNPSSSFYLSLGIDYPNSADKKRSIFKDLGGDIFIHGSCVSIGCLPITDNYIKELYLMAMFAKNNQQSKIPVYIFPFKMEEVTISSALDKHKSNPMLTKFWVNLKEGYMAFKKDKRALKVSAGATGLYKFN